MAITYWTSTGAGNWTSGSISASIFTRSGSNGGSRTITIEGLAPTLSVGTAITLKFNTSTIGTGTYNGTLTYNGTHYPIVTLGATTYVLDVNIPSGSYSVANAVICYLRGTHIMTAHGEVAVEDISPGDVVLTRFGPLRPVRWVGQQSFDGRFLGKHNAPVCFARGSLGENVPHSDLWVSADHSMVIDDHLVPARLLVNGVTVTQQITRGQVGYFHIDLGTHDCIVANGAWSESYADQLNRHQFHNHADFDDACPDHVPAPQAMCLPQVGGEDPRLPTLRARIAARIPGSHITAEADLHLIADGVRIDPIDHFDGAWFRVPAGTRSLRLRSHASVPATLGHTNDDRTLGYCVDAIMTQSGTAKTHLKLDTPDLSDGWHRMETDGRWTNGDADLSPGLRAAGDDEIWLMITGATQPRYLLPAQSTTARRPALASAGRDAA